MIKFDLHLSLAGSNGCPCEILSIQDGKNRVKLFGSDLKLQRMQSMRGPVYKTISGDPKYLYQDTTSKLWNVSKMINFTSKR